MKNKKSFIVHQLSFFKMSVRYFALSALLFGSLFVFIVPPFQVADEFNHFYRAWQVSDGIVVGIRTADNRLGGDLPVSVAKITQAFRSLPFHVENQVKSNTIFYNLTIPLDVNNLEFVDFSNTAIYPPTAYLPQAVAISIGKFFKMTPLSIFYFSRFLTLLFWLSMLYATLKIIPIQRNLFAALALLPSSLFINASASGDVVTNACSFLLIASFLKMIIEKKGFSKRTLLSHLTVIFVASLTMSLNKLTYFPLIFFIFLVKKEQVNGIKNKAIIATTLIAANLAVIAFWSNKIQPLYLRFEDYNPAFRIGQQLNENVDPSAQMSFILHNPLAFTQIATFSLLKSLPHTLMHYVGKFGWEKNYLPLSIIAILVLLIVIQSITNEKKQTVPAKQLDLKQIFNSEFLIFDSEAPLSIKAKLSIFCIGILMTFSFAAGMYAIWCPVGSPFIENLGGKYFIPIYPLFFLALPTITLKTSAKLHTSPTLKSSKLARSLHFLAQPQILFGALYGALMWSVVQVVTRYYG